MHDHDDLKESVKRLANGSTVGMVEAALTRKGVQSGPRDEVLQIARRIINRRSRIKHSIVFLIGVLIFAAGGYWLYAHAQNGNPMVRIPGSIMGFGLITAIYGLYFSFQNKV